MKSFLFKMISLIMLAGMTWPVQAESVKLNVDIASHVSVLLDGEEVPLANGNNTIDIKRNAWLEIKSTQGWELSRVTLNDEEQDFSKIYGYSIFFEDDDTIDYGSYSYVVRTKKAEDRSGDATFIVSGARYIDSFIYDEYHMHTLQDGEQTFHFANEYEAEITIYFLEEGVTATVTQNGSPVLVDKENYNMCRLNLANGDVIVIDAKPDEVQHSSRITVDGLIGVRQALAGESPLTLAEGENFLDFEQGTTATLSIEFFPGTTPVVTVDGIPADITDDECRIVLNGGENVTVQTGCPYSESKLNLIVDNAQAVSYIQFDYVNQEFFDGFQTLDVRGNTKLEMSINARDKYQYVALNGKELDIAYNTPGFYSAYVNPGDRLVIVTDNGDRPVDPPVVKEPDGILTLSVNNASGLNCAVKGELVDLHDGANEVGFYTYGWIEISPVEGFVITRVLLDEVEQEITPAGGWDIYVGPDELKLLDGKTLAILVQEDSETGVGSVSVAGSSVFDVYSIDGRCILSGADEADVRGLGAGMYIINGHKVIIRK